MRTMRDPTAEAALANITRSEAKKGIERKIKSDQRKARRAENKRLRESKEGSV